uniref:PhoX n=1 Tax=Mycobacterium leprae TaxID=1769 RepID=Q50045_MYCLR|nr:phoX [Mycobacterium leprae]
MVGGGAYHVIVGTLLQGLICTAISMPIVFMVGIYLVEYGSGTTLAHASYIHDGYPKCSILDRGGTVLIYVLCVATLGLVCAKFMMALVLLMLPVDRLGYRENAANRSDGSARGQLHSKGSEGKKIAIIVIPKSLSGIVTEIMLVLARVMGEMAPLLILVGYSQEINFGIFRGFIGSLPGMMCDQTSADVDNNTVNTDRL